MTKRFGITSTSSVFPFRSVIRKFSVPFAIDQLSRKLRATQMWPYAKVYRACPCTSLNKDLSFEAVKGWCNLFYLSLVSLRTRHDDFVKLSLNRDTGSKTFAMQNDRIKQRFFASFSWGFSCRKKRWQREAKQYAIMKQTISVSVVPVKLEKRHSWISEWIVDRYFEKRDKRLEFTYNVKINAMGGK